MEGGDFGTISGIAEEAQRPPSGKHRLQRSEPVTKTEAYTIIYHKSPSKHHAATDI
ncbi:hypothetical protein KP77_14160 [Jeotgalibacillus alimentarius]|uniref:Uncharacterized protein n=1 Tax=Jeotgalibacillus alimentarius TaxID=135826 RepID=A0A0C2W2D8_9BACL|nr:hypothetical protein KP77_14160 [Jeotgalibacillus alimentarius]